MPVPPVYVLLDDERGINAFAAGLTPPTRWWLSPGAPSTIKRHELQGVIAHEFSHILNGDMRLNIPPGGAAEGDYLYRDVGPSSCAAATGPTGLVSATVRRLHAHVRAGAVAAGPGRRRDCRLHQGHQPPERPGRRQRSAVYRDPDGIGDALKVIGGYIPGTLVTRPGRRKSRIFSVRSSTGCAMYSRPAAAAGTHPAANTGTAYISSAGTITYPPRQAHAPGRRGAGGDHRGRSCGLGCRPAAGGGWHSGAGGCGRRGPSPDELTAQTAQRTAERRGLPAPQPTSRWGPALIFCLLISGPRRRATKRSWPPHRGSGTTGLTDLVHRPWRSGTQARPAPAAAGVVPAGTQGHVGWRSSGCSSAPCWA